MNKANILVVDDESLNIQIISEILKDKYNIKVAFDGQKALNIVQKINIDLILLDISMPKMDGYEVAKKLQEDPKTSHIPFIFITAKQDQESVIKGFKFGAIDYISKPFNKEELVARVSNHLKTHLLQKDLIEQKDFTQTILDTQNNMIIVTNGEKIDFVNRSFLDFFECKDIEEYISKYQCISRSFIKSDTYFDENENWLEKIQEINPEDRKVEIFSKDSTKNSFNLSLKPYKDGRFIINLNKLSI